MDDDIRNQKHPDRANQHRIPIISFGVLKVTISPIAISVDSRIHGISNAYSRASAHLFLYLCNILDATSANATTMTEVCGI